MFKNTKKQGDWGLGVAIAYFAKLGYTICLPLTDSQDYDLIVDIDNKLQRVQIKTTTYKKHNNYSISLTVKGGNQSYSTIKKLDKTKVDQVFVVTADDTKYLIPVDKIGQSVSLGEKYDIFRL